jgi:hypothetical protein
MTGPAPAGHLRTLLARRVREVVDRAATGQEPTKEEVDSLDRLARLAAMEQSVLRAQQRRMAGLLLLALAIAAATLVLTIRVWWDGDIAVDAEVTSLSFVPADPAWLVAGLAVDSLELRDVDSIRVTQLRDRRDTTVGPARVITLKTFAGEGRRNYITIASLAAAETSLVSLRLPDSAMVRADFRPAGSSFDASAASMVEARADGDVTFLDFQRTGQIRVFHGANPIAVTWRSANGQSEFPAPVRVTKLDLFALDPRNGEPVSTLRRGAVYRESLGRDSVRLRRDETLTIERPDGLLRSLVAKENGIALFFRGRAGDVSTAIGGVQQTLRPTLLEWARAQNGVWWLWTTILGIAGVLLGVRRWWREPK